VKRTDIINKLIQRFGYTSYLEVGTQDPNSNFNKINIPNKVSIDPFPRGTVTFVGTSDEYFESIDESVKYDIIFIDGLHHSDQVTKDIENSLKHLSENGTIVCHDCLPTTEKMQLREDHGGEWTGDTWKAIAELRTTRTDLDIRVVNTDYGCGIIRRGTQEVYKPTSPDYLTYDYFKDNKYDMMNSVSPQHFIEWLNESIVEVNEYTVVIPTLWKSTRIHKLLQDLIQCDSVGEIILIDNSSEFYNHYTELEKVRVIQPAENLYVNPSWNLGTKEAKYNCVALVNDDINFDTVIFDTLNESQLKSLGIIGMNEDNYKSVEFTEPPQLHPMRNGHRPWGWGCFILFHKSNWIPIPDDIKIWYGDDFVKEFNPVSKYILHNFPIDTEMSTTSDEIIWNERKELDKTNFYKLYRNG
jgi:hypothetical protein